MSTTITATPATDAQERCSYMLTLAYKGAGFSGFARQNDPAVRTIQEELEQALAVALRLDTPPQTVCAGRTDAGVHAAAQVVSFDLPLLLDTRQCNQLLRSLNALTCAEISIAGLRRAAPGFSARFDALSRSYCYRIFNQVQPPIFTADFAWHVARPLDVQQMRLAADQLLGEHDFASFCSALAAKQAADEGKSTRRTLTQIDIATQQCLGEEVLAITVTGNAFLHSMVRIIVGTLQEVGAGKRAASEIPAILAARDRSAAGLTAAACGLTLQRVEYPAHK
ncbi:MAG: tRNA pseudouridine(38-40) synthase TruA [Coriobacteriia bacterium]|nr:tRNA pseudouridine(38-40) synthase TruA [Coriobacteriia bacterium]